jgi:hypothetical protein
MVENACPQASRKSGNVRGVSDRQRDVTFAPQRAIGFSSGEYVGRHRTQAPAASLASSSSARV